MMHLAYDISRCGNDTCPLSENCLRYLVPGTPDGSQSFTAFPGGRDCYAHIPAQADTSDD